MEFLRIIHSLVRYLVMLGSLVALVWFVLVWLKQITSGENRDRMLMAIFTGLIDLQVLIGLIFLVAAAINDGSWPRFRLEHSVTMIVAAAVAHLPMRWRKSDLPRVTKVRNNVLVIIAVFVIVLVGISRLPYDTWRFGG